MYLRQYTHTPKTPIIIYAHAQMLTRTHTHTRAYMYTDTHHKHTHPEQTPTGTHADTEKRRHANTYTNAHTHITEQVKVGRAETSNILVFFTKRSLKLILTSHVLTAVFDPF